MDEKPPSVKTGRKRTQSPAVLCVLSPRPSAAGGLVFSVDEVVQRLHRAPELAALEDDDGRAVDILIVVGIVHGEAELLEQLLTGLHAVADAAAQHAHGDIEDRVGADIGLEG